jgi:ABC-type sugar transport system ATPase subunit
MKALEISSLSMQAGNFRVENINLEIDEGEYFVLMGMTGSGKSLLLKAICGLAQIEGGTVKIHERDVTALESRFRNIGYVPQDGGLFPHLSVTQNIVFSQTIAGVSPADATEPVSEIVDYLNIGYLLNRTIRNLSGGERQKVSLARALARKPEILVLDEPVCALDEPTRRDICRELCRVQKEFGVATLHVCHSRDEAELVSDRVGVMSEGKLIDVGLLKELATGSEHSAVQRLFNWS